MNTDDLPLPYRHAADAAIGWLMLSDWNAAESEISNIPDEFATCSTILKIHIRIYLKTNRSQRALALAEILIRTYPNEPEGWNHRALALRNLGRMHEAYIQLLLALPQFPHHYAISYNLACYLCQMGRLEEAIPMLAWTFSVEDSMNRRLRALADPDLQPLWVWQGIRTTSNLPKLWNSQPCAKNQTRICGVGYFWRNSLN